MGSKVKQIAFWIVLGLAVLILAAAGLILGWRRGLPLRMTDHYSLEALQEEMITMGDCAECHDGPDFHRCSTCHDEHGAVEFADLPFFNLVSLTGDVPRPGFIEVNQILPYRDHPGTSIKLVDFLAAQGVADFASVTMISRDGGLVTISRENLTDQALLMPYSDGIRFASEDLHVSTWLKGITTLIVVGEDPDLLIDGEPTSIGRLLLGPTRQVVVESARVMLSSEIDGQIRDAETASRQWGAALSDLAPDGGYSSLAVRDQAGVLYHFSLQEVRQAVLIAAAGGPTLVLPDQPRSNWIRGIASLEWEE